MLKPVIHQDDLRIEFLNGDPRIALCWEDWDPSSGGTVYYVPSASQASIVST